MSAFRPLRSLRRTLVASLLVLGACAGNDDEPSASAVAPPLGQENAARVCRDGCTLDLRSTCDDDVPRATCAEPFGCSAGHCVTPCAAAAGNHSSAGCSFYSAVPDTTAARGACFALVLTNAWSVPARIAIEYDGIGVDVRRVLRAPRGSGQNVVYEPLEAPEIAPGDVAIAFVSEGGAGLGEGEGACPAAVGGAGMFADVAVHGPGVGKAFHVRSSVPVTAHAIYPFGGATTGIGTATVLYPDHSWDRTTSAIELDMAYGTGPLLQLVSATENNAVTIMPREAIRGGGPVLSDSPADQKVTVRPNAGDFVQFSQNGQFSLNGSSVESEFGVALFAGSACTHSGVASCDPVFQQIPPSRWLGREYVAVRQRDRFEGVVENTPWHFVGVTDGTMLEYEPAAPPGAPLALSAGQIVQFRSSTPFVVRSQDDAHPFYAAVMMESCRTYGTDDDCRGDPEIMSLVPTSRYGEQVRFFSDPSYPETDLVVVRAKATDGRFRDVSLDCLPTVDGWQAIGDRFEVAHVALSRGNYEVQGACGNGMHALQSAGPVTANVWGWGSAATRIASGVVTESASYAYAILAEPRQDTAPVGSVR